MAGNVAEWVFGCAPLTSDVGVAADLSRGCARLALGGSAATGDSLTWTQSAGPSHASASIGVRVARDLPAN